MHVTSTDIVRWGSAILLRIRGCDKYSSAFQVGARDARPLHALLSMTEDGMCGRWVRRTEQ